MELQDQVAVITGGAGNLGSTVTRHMLQEGARVLVPWHKEENWRELRNGLPDELRGRCDGVQADLTREEHVERTMRATVDRHGRLDVLLNLAGGFAFGRKVWEMDVDAWDRMMDMNLKTAFLCAKHALPHMLERGRGRIVNVSSKAAVDIQPGASAYAVSKAGVITLTRALREELKGTGVTANAVMPSIIDTPVTRRLMPDADPEDWVTPAEIADVLVALCSDRCRAVSGSTVRVFGGL